MSAHDLQNPNAILFNPHVCFEEVLRLSEPHAQEKHRTLMWDIHTNVPERVVGDPQRLRQLVGHLVHQAIEDTHTGLVAVHAELEAKTTEAIWLHFSVADAGAILPLDWQQNLLEGLDGRIWWDNLPDTGTVAHVHLRFEWPRATNDSMVFDPSATVARVGGDQALLREAIDLFLVDSALRLEQMRAALAAENADQVRRAGHALKGQVLFFGARTTAESLARLSRCVVANEWAGARVEFTTLQIQVLSLQQHLRTFAAENTP